MVEGARVRRVVVLEEVGVGKRVECVLWWDARVVVVENTSEGEVVARQDGPAHAAVAEPEHLPLVAVRRYLGLYRRRQVVHAELARIYDIVVAWVGIRWVGVLGRCTGQERLGECACRQSGVDEEGSDANIPGRVILQDECTGEVASNNSVWPG